MRENTGADGVLMSIATGAGLDVATVVVVAVVGVVGAVVAGAGVVVIGLDVGVPAA